ncbi:LysM domain-containing protein [Kytococcus aerolatus]|uniref:LysM domain-containing protein n=1 Tax=Kytococcus aerolatus TaxID=592308 RepID=A0A212U050_9MICO|nr:LysM peptidoglycan-binding domain-containing protein [Kytococcus aerolatus]SNC71501.1 LysM domain-containing protein [Kytococcus aerolatus]
MHAPVPSLAHRALHREEKHSSPGRVPVWAALLAGAVGLALSALTVELGRGLTRRAEAVLDPTHPAAALTWGVQLCLTVVLAWLAGVLALEGLARVPGMAGAPFRSARRALGPWAGGALLSLVVGLATSSGTAHAGPGEAAAPRAGSTSSSVAGSLTADPLDLRPLLTETEERTAESAGPAPKTVTVRTGDTLWELAARHLGEDASPARIAHEWPRWYAENRELVGEDPDLLQPGTELRVPGTEDVR